MKYINKTKVSRQTAIRHCGCAGNIPTTMSNNPKAAHLFTTQRNYFSFG